MGMPENLFLVRHGQSEGNLVRKQYTRSSGKGGQNVNKRDTCVQLTDMKSGVQVKVQDFRTQKENEETAWIRLEEKIKEEKYKKWIQSIEKNRFEQIGLSKRSDRISQRH